jgi:hypothetical protein
VIRRGDTVSIVGSVKARSSYERSRPATGRLLSFRENSSNGGKPSELSGEILWAMDGGVKAKS